MNFEGSLLFVLHLFLTRLHGASASCPETVYLERGVDGIINCFYEDCNIITWSITGNINAFVVYQNNVRSGSEFDSGEYDLLLDGSLVIRNVSEQHERQYSIRVRTNRYQEISSDVTVRVFVRPIPEFPVINGLADRQNLLLKVERLWDMECALENVRPAISLGWVIVDGFPPNNLVINNDTTTRDHCDGTFSIHLRSNFKMTDTSAQSFTILCVVIGPDVLSSNASADVLVSSVSDPVSTELVPVIEGCYSKGLDCVQVMTSSTGSLTCYIMGLPTTNDVGLEWTPLGDYESLNWDQTKLSNASFGTVTRSLYYSIDRSSGVSLLEFRCRLYEKEFEHVIGSADVVIEVQYSEDQGRHQRQTTALLVIVIMFISAFLLCLIVSKRKMIRGIEPPGSNRVMTITT